MIPSSVESIDAGILTYTALTKIVVDERNKCFDSRGGCNAIIDSRTNRLIAGCSTTIIPDGVESIYYSAFEGVDVPARMTFPNTLKEIYPYAFTSCETLQSITLPDSIEVLHKLAFAKCPHLSEVNLGHSLKTIQEEVFGDCVSLRELVIPASVEMINDYAFAHCTSLWKVRFEQLTRLCDAIFYGCPMLVDIHVPEEFVPIYRVDVGEEHSEQIKGYKI